MLTYQTEANAPLSVEIKWVQMIGNLQKKTKGLSIIYITNETLFNE